MHHPSFRYLHSISHSHSLRHLPLKEQHNSCTHLYIATFFYIKYSTCCHHTITANINITAALPPPDQIHCTPLITTKQPHSASCILRLIVLNHVHNSTCTNTTCARIQSLNFSLLSLHIVAESHSNWYLCFLCDAKRWQNIYRKFEAMW